MADNKKTPPKKPAAKKPGPASPARKRSASRPPTIELKADEVVDKTSPKPADKPAAKAADKPAEKAVENPVKPKPAKPAQKAESEKEAMKKQGQEKKPNEPHAQAPVSKSKTPLIAAGLAGLLAGTAGGIVAGLILTGSGSEPQDGESLAQLQNRLQKIEQGQKTPAPVSNLLPRLDKAESDFRFLGTQLDTLQKDIATLKDQLAVFSSTLTPSPDGAVPAASIDVSGLQAKIVQLQSQIEERDKQAADLSGKIEALQKTLDAQGAAQQEASKKTETAVSAVQETTQAYAALKQSVDQKISKLYQAGGDNRIRAAALSLSLRQLSDVVKGDAPFARETDALGALLGKNALLDEIKPFAKTGVADLARLRAEFAQVNPAPAPKKPAVPEGSLLDKIVSNAKSVVRIRKVGEGGDAPQDPLTSVKQALAAGDLPNVIKMSDTLDPQTKEKYQPWLKSVGDRVSLDTLFAKLQNVILAEIGKSTQAGEEPVIKSEAPAKPKPIPSAKTEPSAPSQPLSREVAQ